MGSHSGGVACDTISQRQHAWQRIIGAYVIGCGIFWDGKTVVTAKKALSAGIVSDGVSFGMLVEVY